MTGNSSDNLSLEELQTQNPKILKTRVIDGYISGANRCKQIINS